MAYRLHVQRLDVDIVGLCLGKGSLQGSHIVGRHDNGKVALVVIKARQVLLWVHSVLGRWTMSEQAVTYLIDASARVGKAGRAVSAAIEGALQAHHANGTALVDATRGWWGGASWRV